METIMNELFQEFYELSESILVKHCTKIQADELPDEETDIATIQNIKIMVHEVNDSGVYVYLCIHKNSGKSEFNYPDLLESPFGYRARDEEVFINAVHELEFKIWSVNPPEVDDLESIDLAHLNKIMKDVV